MLQRLGWPGRVLRGWEWLVRQDQAAGARPWSSVLPLSTTGGWNFWEFPSRGCCWMSVWQLSFGDLGQGSLSSCGGCTCPAPVCLLYALRRWMLTSLLPSRSPAPLQARTTATRRPTPSAARRLCTSLRTTPTSGAWPLLSALFVSAFQGRSQVVRGPCLLWDQPACLWEQLVACVLGAFGCFYFGSIWLLFATCCLLFRRPASTHCRGCPLGIRDLSE